MTLIMEEKTLALLHLGNFVGPVGFNIHLNGGNLIPFHIFFHHIFQFLNSSLRKITIFQITFVTYYYIIKIVRSNYILLRKNTVNLCE